MVHASHVIFGAYGFWLPNDPRGSWSDFVRSWELFRYGPATKTDTRRSVAANRHDTSARLSAKQALKYPPVKFNGSQAKAIGEGFSDFVQKSGVSILACAILPDHLHLVIARHRYQVEQVVNLLKGAAASELVKQGIHPFLHLKHDDAALPKCFAQKSWKVFLDCNADIRRAIAYADNNPEKEGLRRQRWSFVSEFRGIGF
jgi:REP element-mobilizing transposase RayT